jgi:hypothetical protein
LTPPPRARIAPLAPAMRFFVMAVTSQMQGHC